MDSGKLDRGVVRRDWNAKITERIERDRCADESRGGHLRPGNRILELAVTEPGVVPPAAVEELVPLDADGAQPRVGFVIEQTVSKLSQTRAGRLVSAWVGVLGGSAPGAIDECGGMANVV